jgi:RNA polymerase sigma factor (sigma-70 family)
MKEYSSTEIIRGIGKCRDSIVRYVYQRSYPDVRKLILTNGGKEHDAEDIFQEGLLKVYQKITADGLQLTCKFNTYLYSVCRFLWLQELEKRKSMKRESLAFEALMDDQAANQEILENAQLRLYEQHFSEMSKECQKVLNMYFLKASMEEICVVMGYKNVQIAKDKKYRCKKSLMERIYGNPEFKRLQDELHLAG